jgi:uncharacterized membrane protein
MSLLVHNGPWMAWNVVLALVPLVAAVALFTGDRRHTVAWWLGAALFLVFLPNAPYVLTDVVHLIDGGRSVQGSSALIMALVAQYAALFAIGIVAFVASLELLRGHLTRAGWPARRVARAELAVQAACAVGVYLGRFGRLNSWELGAEPARVLLGRADRLSAWVIVATTFMILVAITALARACWAGAVVEWHRRRGHTA